MCTFMPIASVAAAQHGSLLADAAAFAAASTAPSAASTAAASASKQRTARRHGRAQPPLVIHRDGVRLQPLRRP
jgi:hypothetical protein